MPDRLKPTVQSAQDAVIMLEDSAPLMKKQKRDRAGSKTSVMTKKLKADAAMGTSLEITLGENGTYKNEYTTIEDDLLEISDTSPPSTEDAEVEYDEADELDAEIPGNTVRGPKLTPAIKAKLELAKKNKIVGDSKVLDGLMLSKYQRQFIVNLCNPDSGTYNDKFASFIEAGYNASSKHVLISNVSKLLGNKKVKEGVARYRKDMITSKKLEISTETIDILRKRATYDVSMFYKNGDVDNGEVKPLNEIPEEWRCCIDGVDTDYKGSAAQQKLIKYKLCNRDNAIKALTQLLEIQQAISGNTGPGAPLNTSIQAALDMGKDKEGNQGPRFVFNLNVAESNNGNG